MTAFSLFYYLILLISGNPCTKRVGFLDCWRNFWHLLLVDCDGNHEFFSVYYRVGVHSHPNHSLYEYFAFQLSGLISSIQFYCFCILLFTSLQWLVFGIAGRNFTVWLGPFFSCYAGDYWCLSTVPSRSPFFCIQGNKNKYNVIARDDYIAW